MKSEGGRKVGKWEVRKNLDKFKNPESRKQESEVGFFFLSIKRFDQMYDVCKSLSLSLYFSLVFDVVAIRCFVVVVLSQQEEQT